MKDDFYKDIEHKRSQEETAQSKKKTKNKEKYDNAKKEEPTMKRSAKYKEKETTNNQSNQFSDKFKKYLNKENLNKGKAFFAGKFATYNKQLNNELKVTKEKLNELRKKPQNQNNTSAEDHQEDEDSSKKGLIPMIIGGIIIVPITIILAFLIISNFWPSNDGMELATEENDAEESQKDRKSTRLNSSHVAISYAVFCLKKKIILHAHHRQTIIL